jgi:hypothetical protein
MSNTPKLGLPEFAAAQALPETKANDVSRRVEQGAGLFIVADKDATSPPGSPAQGVAYIVAASATGAWSGHDGEIAYYQNTAWKFIVPGEGFFTWVLDESALYHFVSSAWSTYAVGGLGTASTLDFDTDGTLAANSDSKIATQKAVKTAIAAAVTGLFDFKGSTDCSANPNYPAASKGDAYVVSVAGKIGGGSGLSVDVGDVYVASADNAGGTQTSVGASWFLLEHNLAGALLAANNLSDLASAATSRTNLGATTVGGNVFTLTNPSAVRYLRVNADNTVDALDASAFRAAIGAGTGSGGGDLLSTNNLSDVASAPTSRTNLGLGTVSTLASDTDGTLAANSDAKVATQKAVKTYVDGAVTGLLDFKGSTDCSANPNYPAASKGDAYVVSVAGKIGGASGSSVDIGDVYVASADNAGGTQASVGASWFLLEHNLAGALLAANNLSDVANAATARANLGVGFYRVGLFFTTTPTVSEVVALHVAADAFTFPANFATPDSKGSCGTNPTATFALDVQKNGSTIGTITISTGGVFTFATASGTSKSIAAGDVIKIVAPSPVDSTCANVAITLKGTI